MIKMKCITVLGIVLFCALVYGNPICPEPELIVPCTCKIVAYGLNVVCANVKSSHELREKFLKLSGYQVDNLLLHALNFSSGATDDLFVGMTVNVLQVEMSRMKFTGDAFRGLENSLKQLKIMNCLSVTSPIKLARLNKLQDFYFRNNKLATVSKNWLDKIPNVRLMNLDNNDIGSAEEDAFSSLKELSEISMADNRISTVTRNIFPSPAFKLTKIDLSDNQLSSLPTDFFEYMPNLQKVVLTGNNLRSLPEETWSKIWSQLNTVILHGNHIVCDDRIDWIKDKKKPLTLEGTCEEPLSVNGKKLKQVLSK